MKAAKARGVRLGSHHPAVPHLTLEASLIGAALGSVSNRKKAIAGYADLLPTIRARQWQINARDCCDVECGRVPNAQQCGLDRNAGLPRLTARRVRRPAAAVSEPFWFDFPVLFRAGCQIEIATYAASPCAAAAFERKGSIFLNGLNVAAHIHMAMNLPFVLAFAKVLLKRL